MRVQKTPRYQGKITSWKDEQGFGFITPNGGGQEVFVHIKSFAGGGVRPASGDIVTYELGLNQKGQPRAGNVAFVSAADARPPARSTGRAALAGAAGFLALLAVASLSGNLPGLVLGLYAGMSVLAFIAYAADKSAARQGKRRTSENALHLLGLLGGWPGALAAQNIFRHKTKKTSFRLIFWVTVLVNCGVLGWLLSTAGASTWP